MRLEALNKKIQKKGSHLKIAFGTAFMRAQESFTFIIMCRHMRSQICCEYSIKYKYYRSSIVISIEHREKKKKLTRTCKGFVAFWTAFYIVVLLEVFLQRRPRRESGMDKLHTTVKQLSSSE